MLISVGGCGDKLDNSGTTNTTSATKATLSGTVSEVVAKPSLKPTGNGTGVLHSAMGGGVVKIIGSSGFAVSAATIATDGTYSVTVDKGANYVVKATKGNVCLKSFVEKADADKTITVDPTSSAIVKALGKTIGNDKIGDEGEDVSSLISAADVAAIIAAINNSNLLATVAAAIQADISANANYTSTTVTVGAASTAGDSHAAAIAISITITVTVPGQGNAPPAPTGVTAAAGNGQVTVSWNAVTGATSYNLYYSGTAGVAGIKINGITTGTSYTLTGLTNGTTYYFTVTASNSSGESAGSSQLKVATLSSISVTPASGTVVVGNTQQFTATGIYSDGSLADISAAVAWSSSSSSVTIDSTSGLATGVSTGSATITATLNGISGTSTLISSYVIKTIPAPTIHTVGLAWDGSNLWVATNPDVNRTIVKIDFNGTILASISQLIAGQAVGMRDIEFIGTDLWAVSQFNSQIYRITTSGNVLGSIPGTYSLHGLAYDGTYIWYTQENMSTMSGSVRQITTGGAETGKFINFPADRPACLAYDGTHLWVGTQNGGLQKYDINGNKIASYNIDVASGNCAMTFDGHNLWLTSDTMYIQKLALP